MAQTEAEALAALEHLMEQFFNPLTTNERKREIDQVLNSFSSQRNAWKLCIYFLEHTSNPYVLMCALSTIESVINRQWIYLDPTEQLFLKKSLTVYTGDLNSTTPNFIRNKLAKILVDIGKQEWPKYYLDHYDILLQLLQSDEGQLLGLILLKTTSEELLNPNCSNISSSQKELLATLCEVHIPQIFQLLTAILEGLSNRRRHNVTATPPPSPTHPSQAPNLAQQISAASFRPDSRDVSREVLTTLQHLFTWAQLSQVPAQLINTIFKFTNVSSYAQDDDDMCLLAMSALNELLYRKCVPPGSQGLFVQIYHHTVQLVRDISNPSCANTLGPDFVDKVSELLALLVEQHLWRLESEPGFSAIELMGHLYQLTMQLPLAQSYLRCLTVWAAFIKQIKPHNTQKYSEALLSLVIAVLNKMQFTCNITQLEGINNVEVNDNDETEWQMFQHASIEVIALIAEFAPMETFSRVLNPWNTSNDVYLMLRSMDVSSGTMTLVASETQRLHCILKDLSTLTQTLARLSSYFMDQDADHFKEASQLIETLLSKLIETALMSDALRFYNLRFDEYKQLKDDFTEVHCQILSALKTWCSWYNLNRSTKSRDLNQLLQVVLPILRSTTALPPKVTLSAAHLLLSITTIIHPPHFIQMPEALDLIHVVSTLRFPRNQSREIILCALATFLLKPWGELSGSDSQARNTLIGNFFDAITRDYRQISDHCNNDDYRCREITADCLPCLTNIIDYCKEYPVLSKKLLYAALKSTIEHTLAVFSGMAKYPEVNELQLQFFFKVLEVLQQQFGLAGVQHAVDVFLDVAVREQQRQQFSGLDTLLKILQLVVESPGSSYKNFMQGIFNLCMKDIYPNLIQQANEHPDAIIALINLLHSILLNRWNYFYVSQIRLGNSPGCSDVEPSPDSPQQQEQLLQVLQVFGQCLLQPDINTFRTSLMALENLNNKWKLYHKALFKEQVLGQFLTVLLQTLLDKSHNLLNEDIMFAFYNMASVGFSQFFDRFITEFLTNFDGLTPQQRTVLKSNFTNETDMPTFVQNLQRCVNDMRCFLVCNASLPAGSVIL